MFGSSPFSHKSIEKYLVSICGNAVKTDKHTMRYIKSMAKNTESAYKIGLRDGMVGKALVPKEKLVGVTQEDELTAAAVDFSYQAYRTGHAIGTAQRG